MTRAAILSLALIAACSPVAGCCGPGSTEAILRDFGSGVEISIALAEQQAAWNSGDLAAFMERGYWNSPDLTFFSGGNVSRGYDEMLAHYRESYEGPDKERGTLAFTDLEVVMLAENLALARGRWDLDYAEKPDVGGLFSLVWCRMDEGWRITHDHTSVDG